tara:strand:- start:1301 stop:1714 length:414 start_codon:yes stop_codon:yes gene_type:complete
MKNFQLIILILFLNYTGFSQEDTTIVYEDTTVYNGINYTDKKYEVICFAPNAITPNGNGGNEEWIPVLINNNPWRFQVIIYNRLGSTIWESYDQSIGWDGTLNGEPIMAGVYVWYITTRSNETDKKFEFKGFVTVIR